MKDLYKIAKKVIALEFNDYTDYNNYSKNHKIRKNTVIKFPKNNVLKNKKEVDNNWVNSIGHESFNEIVNSPSIEVVKDGKNKILKHEEKSPSGKLIETKFVKNSKSDNGFNKSQNRVAMFQLSRLLGFNNIPPTSYSKYNSKDQSITGTEEIIVKGEQLEKGKNYSSKYKKDNNFRKGIQQIAILDIISGNKKRNEDSVKFNSKGVFASDNSDTFNEKEFIEDTQIESFVFELLGCEKRNNYEEIMKEIVERSLIDDEVKQNVLNVNEKEVEKMIYSMYGDDSEPIVKSVLSRFNKLKSGLVNGFIPNENNFEFNNKKAEELFTNFLNVKGIDQDSCDQIGNDLSKFYRSILKEDYKKAQYRKSPEIAKKDFLASLNRNNYKDLKSFQKAIEYFTRMSPLEFIDILFSIEV